MEGVIPRVGVGVLSDPVHAGLAVAERVLSITVALELLLEPSPEVGLRLALLLAPCPPPHQDSPAALSHPQ